ncbi:stage V sporulation protein AE [Selenomonadales bacterium OttesenSCG-928-I06]|nr:stage V sporulation protein AE [Selenomonadales bacterium OttesenSCG-928-I06]
MQNNKKVRVILVTDGDKAAQKAVEESAHALNLRCISASAGNPTPIDGQEIVNLVKKAPYDPVLIMFDDRGNPGKWQGEGALEYVASHPDIQVLGAVAVASNTGDYQGIEADVCIDSEGHFIEDASVDKRGHKKNTINHTPIILGDTVDVLNEFNIPVIIGVGDLGKMDNKDTVLKGCPITKKAIEEILKRNGIQHERLQ